MVLGSPFIFVPIGFEQVTHIAFGSFQVSMECSGIGGIERCFNRYWQNVRHGVREPMSRDPVPDLQTPDAHNLLPISVADEFMRLCFQGHPERNPDGPDVWQPQVCSNHCDPNAPPPPFEPHPFRFIWCH